MKKTTLKHLKKCLIAAVVLLSTLQLKAQVPGVVRCFTDQSDSILRANHPELEPSMQFEEWIYQEIEYAKTHKIIGGVYQIPVVVHVIHNGEAVGTASNVSYAAVQSQIDVLNEDFRRIFGSNGYNTHPDGADTKIEFCLAKRRPDGSAFPNSEDGVNRINRTSIGTTAPPFSQAYVENTIKAYTYNNNTPTATRGWDPAKYMNIWLCDLGSGLLGYAQFPQSPLGGMGCGTPVAGTDGVVFLYSSIGKSSVTGFAGPYNEGRTATHEIGHWLGLRHIWGDGNCSATDYCNDTPPAAAPNYGCPTGTNSCTAAPDQGPDMIENYMDYTDDGCMNIFTNDQKQRMRAVLEGSPLRVSLINSDACTPPNPSDASITDVFAPIGDNCVGSITPSVQLRNRGGTALTSATISYKIDNGTATTFNWTGNLAAGASATVSLPAFTASTLGTHSFIAYSTLPNGVTDPYTVYDTSAIAFVVSNGLTAPFTETFDTGDFPTDPKWYINNGGNDCFKWSPAVGVSISGVLSNNIAEVPCYGNNNTTNIEDLYTPIFLLPCNATAATLKFDVAYRRRTTTSNDQLVVQISTDCGLTWTSVYTKSGNVSPFLYQSATTTGNTEYFPAAAGDWRTETINLMSYVTGSSDNLRFRFRGTSANGNNIFIDNVKFDATTPGEIQLVQATTEVLDGGYYNFPNTLVGGSTTQTFTINNTGTTNLTLTGPITVTGTGFSLGTSFGTTTVAAGGSTTFTLTFAPGTTGNFTGTVSFGTNDCDEGTYNYQINGTAIVTPPVADFSGTPTTICTGGSVAFTNLSTNATSYSWSFTGGTPATSTGASPTVVYNTAGTYAVTLTATNPYGNDVETKTGYITVLAGGTLPLTEGFATAGFPYANWTLVNANGSPTTWARTTAAGVAPTAGNSVMFDNYNYNDSDDDEFRLLPLQMVGYSTAQLTFDVAYAPYNASNFDGLQVLVSTDCGATFTSVYNKSNTTLATTTATTSQFTPTSAQWRNETVSLTPYVGNSSVIVAFRNLSGYGNRLFVDNINITGTSTPTANFTATPNPVCVGQTVTYTSTSTNATSYSWNFGAGATPATATTVGPHNVTYSTAGTKNVSLQINGTGPTSNQTVTVNANPATPTITPSGATTFCAGGSVTLSAPASTSYLWSTGATTQTINVTTSGSYTVTVTNASGCSATSAATTVTVNAAPATPTITPSGATTFCTGGSVTLSAPTSTSYLWSPGGATTQTLNVTTSGSYTVTVSNASGCTATSAATTVTVNALPAVPTITPSGATTFCAGGSVTLSAPASTGYLWSPGGATTQTLNVTTSGSYTVTVSNAAGCTRTSAATVVTVNAAPATPTITPSGATTFCAGGSVTLSAPASTGYLWSPGGATTQTLNVTTSGSYTVTVSNASGCTATSAATTVTVNALPAVPTITPSGATTFCAGGSVTLSAPTSAGYLWSPGGATTQTLNVTTSGSYTVTVSNAAGCTRTSAATTVTVNAAPATPTITPSGPTTFCSGGSVTLSAPASTGYLWSPGGATTQTLNVTTSGSYTVTVSNASGCTATSAATTVTVNAAPATPTITPSGATTFCSGGSVTLSAPTSTGYLWSPGGATTQTLNVTTSGSYTVTVSNASGCTATSAATTVTVNATPATPTITPSGPTTFCSGGSVTLSAPTSTGYLWSPGGATTQTLNVTTSGSYTVTVSNASGCTATSAATTVTVNATPATPTITPSGSTTFCSGGSVTLSAPTSNGYLWSPGGATTQTLNVTTGGSYTVTVSNASGCTATSAATPVTVNATPVIAIGTVANPTTCTGANGSIQVTGTGTGNLSWSGTATGTMTGVTLPQTITGLDDGAYTITLMSGAGCTSNTLNQSLSAPSAPATPSITAGGPTNFCPGGSVGLTSSVGTSYLWSTGETSATISVNAAGSYTVQITDASGCTSAMSAPTTVTVNPVPATPTITPSGPTTFCAGGSVDLTSSGSNNTWSTSATSSTITVSTSGSYTVTDQNGFGCTATSAPVAITVTPLPATPTITPSGPTTFCEEDAVVLTSSSATGNTWSTAETTPSISVSTTQNVTLTVTANGCVSLPASQAITVNPNPTVTLGAFTDRCEYNPAFTLSGGLPAGGSYSGNGVSGGMFDPGTAGLGSSTITYSYTDGNGCSGTATNTILVDECLGVEENTINIAFYPNPTSGMVNISSSVAFSEVVVYDQLGKLILVQSVEEAKSATVDLSQFAGGVYTIEVKSANGTVKEPVVIQH